MLIPLSNCIRESAIIHHHFSRLLICRFWRALQLLHGSLCIVEISQNETTVSSGCRYKSITANEEFQMLQEKINKKEPNG